MFHQESELPLPTICDFFGSAFAPGENIINCYLYVRDNGLLDLTNITLSPRNLDRMCEDYDYGGLHYDEPHLPCFYKKDRYNKIFLQMMVEKTEKMYGDKI